MIEKIIKFVEAYWPWILQILGLIAVLVLVMTAYVLAGRWRDRRRRKKAPLSAEQFQAFRRTPGRW